MELTDLTLAGFLCLGGIRCLSYVPQIIRIARDENGASAISYTTWCIWTLANLTTAIYAGVNLRDPYLAAISCIYAVGCIIVVSLTAMKRAQHRRIKRLALSPVLESKDPETAGRNVPREAVRSGQGVRIEQGHMLNSYSGGAAVAALSG